jgi:hypothetical protein
MWKVIVSMIRDAQGVASSKRGAMLWFIFMFSVVVAANLATGGKLKLDPTLQTQLFELVILSMALVFGEPFIKAWMLYRDRNKPAPPLPPAP